MSGGRTHRALWEYLRQRYTYVFKKGTARTGKSRPLFLKEWIEKYIDDINDLHWYVCKEDLLAIRELESQNADEYYSTLNTFFKRVEQQETKEKTVKSK